jgi:hypothetical protein
MSIFQKLIGGILMIGALWISGCYSFSGITIDPNVQTYKVNLYEDNTLDALPGLDQIFTEDLKEKIRTQSRLTYADQNPDVEFTGAIVDYRITSEAPQQGDRLTINWSSSLTINGKGEEKLTFSMTGIGVLVRRDSNYIFKAFNDW